MNTTTETRIKKEDWRRLAHGIKKFLTSEVGNKARGWFAMLVALLFLSNGLNVASSYVGRDFMTSIATRDQAGFTWWAMAYLAVYAASVVTGVTNRFAEERLGLLWREWLSRRLVNRYLEQRTYYCLDKHCPVDNPDQRMAEDTRSFTTTTVSFILILLNNGIAAAAFAGVLWSISPLLFGVAVVYAATGSWLTIRLGRPLIGLNYRQFDKEANFRTDLVQVRKHAESIALTRQEDKHKSKLMLDIDDLVSNLKQTIVINRNMGYFVSGFYYLAGILPTLIIAPAYIDGQIEFGVVTQSAMAFSQLLGAFSLVVSQFPYISTYTAVISRLGILMEGFDQAKEAEAHSPLKHFQQAEGIRYSHVSLYSANNHPVLLKDLSLTVPPGMRLLICGDNEQAKLALFQASAGLWEDGAGEIYEPPPGQIFWLPQRPYLPPGSLRQAILPAATSITEDEIATILAKLQLTPVLARLDGLESERNWETVLSLGEQYLFAVARVLLAAPKYVFLDRPTAALSLGEVREILLPIFMARGIGYVIFTEKEEQENYPKSDYDMVLKLREDGGWTNTIVSNSR